MSERQLIVGIDLNRSQPQICYYEREKENTVTAPMKVGNDAASFREIFDGIEELDRRDPEGEADNTRRSELERMAGETMKRALYTLGLDDPAGQIAGITITVPVLTRSVVHLVQSIYHQLGLSGNRAFLQDYKESCYYHTIYQDRDLWTRNVGFFIFEGQDVTFLAMNKNTQTRPVTFTMQEGITVTLKQDRDSWDEQFYNMINASLRQNVFSCIFLMGSTFERSWAGRSIALLCRAGRKVFVVDNLYARGACYAARERVVQRKFPDCLYLGEDVVRNNIGMKMTIQGKETYYPLITAGVNWYEADTSCECILIGKEHALHFLLSRMDESRQSVSVMQLPEMDERPEGTSRLRIHLFYESAKRCVIEVDDLGFGELYPSSGKVWREILEG
ncbi:MAG: DUF5716 family protein [Eubacterium sp.]|nr:DUF5716 family protein [Eubacterium sp.]